MAQFGNCSFKAIQSVGFDRTFGVTMACLVLVLAGILVSPTAFRQAISAERTPDSIVATCLPGRAVAPVGTEASGQASRTAISLFLGHVEFDWDPEVPGGVYGFGPLPPLCPATYDKAAK
jgi:hypothetical protein